MITKKIPPEIIKNKQIGDVKRISEQSGIPRSTLATAIINKRARGYIYDAIINFYKEKPWLKETTTLRTDK